MSLSPCGIDCGVCPYREKGCAGCRAIEGKPFYIKDFGMEVCALYDCPVNKRGYEGCGNCAELPCQIYEDWRDPSMSDEEHRQSIIDRVNALKGLA